VIRKAANSLRHEELKRLAQATVGRLDFLLSSGPREFENAVAAMFERLGYSVKQTPYSSDGGKDAVATKEAKTFLISARGMKRTG
jgi:HJR/Mrr/RecB family endonuclease